VVRARARVVVVGLDGWAAPRPRGWVVIVCAPIVDIVSSTQQACPVMKKRVRRVGLG
jgi:hypothetical protein